MTFKSIFFILFSFIATSPVLAANGENPTGSTGGGSETTLTNPIKTADVNELIGYAIQAMLGLVGSIALLMFVYGGFTWMLAAGNKEGVEKGKKIIFWATAGMVVIFFSYALVSFLINSLVATGKK